MSLVPINKSTKYLIVGILISLPLLFVIDYVEANYRFDIAVIVLGWAIIGLAFIFYSMYLTIPEVLRAVQKLRNKGNA